MFGKILSQVTVLLIEFKLSDTHQKWLFRVHQDPYLYQKFFISSYLTKKGVDYINGGMYAIDKNNEKIDLEKSIDVGDLCFGIATIYHGVDTVIFLQVQLTL